MEPPELREDLKQEVFLIICEMEECKLVELYSTGNIRFFIVRIIINQMQSGNSPFYKKYRKVKFDQYVEHEYLEGNTNYHNRRTVNDVNMKDHPIDEIIKITDEELEKQTVNAVNGLHWYDQAILRLYAEHGNLRAVSKAVDIPVASVHGTVQKARKIIKREIVYG